MVNSLCTLDLPKILAPPAHPGARTSNFSSLGVAVAIAWSDKLACKVGNYREVEFEITPQKQSALTQYLSTRANGGIL